jgi:hypothetical protein
MTLRSRGFCILSTALLRLLPVFALVASPYDAPAEVTTITGVVLTETSAPIAGATVQAVPDLRRYIVPGQLRAVAETRTDAAGRFTLELLQTNGLTLLTSAPAHSIARSRIPSVESASIALEPAVQIDGAVTDAAGQPLAGAVIGPVLAVSPRRGWRSMRAVPQWLEAGEDGRFRIDHLMPNFEYAFNVAAPGHETQNARARGGRQPIILRLRRGGNALSGTLTTARPAVVPYDYTSVPVRLHGRDLEIAVAPAADGSFAFGGVPDGEFTLEPVLAGERATRPRQLSLPRDADTTFSLDLPPGYFVSGTVYEFETSAPVAGVGVMVFDQVTTTAAGGEFRAGPLYRAGPVQIRLLGGEEWRMQETLRAAVPEANGYDDIAGLQVQARHARRIEFLLEGLPTTGTTTLHLLAARRNARRTVVTSSPVVLTVYDSGEYVAYAESVATGRASALAGFTIGTESTITVNLRLGECAAVEGLVARLMDNETTAATRPFRVTLRTADGASSATAVASAVTDRAGFYRLPCVPPGAYFLDARNVPGTRREERPLKLMAGERQRIDFRFRAGNDFAGRVLHAESGEPVPDVDVSVDVAYHDGRNLRHVLHTGSTGFFTAGDLDASTISLLRIEHPGFVPIREADIVLPRSDYVVRLQRSPTVRVTVNAPAESQWDISLVTGQDLGAPADRARASKVLEQKRAPGGATATFKLPSRGRYYFHAASPDDDPAVSDAVVWSSFEPPPSELTLVPGATGRLVCTMPQEYEGEVTAMNMVIPDGSETTEYKAAASDGRCTFEEVPPGDYVVLAGVLAPAMAAVSANKTTELALKPRELSGIAGRVTLGGSPVVGCVVELTSADDRLLTATTRADGGFEFQEIAPGRYSIVAQVLFREGELRVEREIRVGGAGPQEPIELDLTPPDAVPVMFAAEMGVSVGEPVTFTNVMTRQTSIVRWQADGPEAAIAPGSYEVWLDDELIGTADFVGGRVEVRPRAEE